ncbi:unnamed protein product [Gadus morhua 'NCC']
MNQIHHKFSGGPPSDHPTSGPTQGPPHHQLALPVTTPPPAGPPSDHPTTSWPFQNRPPLLELLQRSSDGLFSTQKQPPEEPLNPDMTTSPNVFTERTSTAPRPPRCTMRLTLEVPLDLCNGDYQEVQLDLCNGDYQEVQLDLCNGDYQEVQLDLCNGDYQEVQLDLCNGDYQEVQLDLCNGD